MPVTTKTMPRTASVRDLQRKYRDLFDYVEETHEPLYIMTQNKPSAVLLSPSYYEDIVKGSELTEDEVLEIVREGERERRAGKTRVLNSLADLD